MLLSRANRLEAEYLEEVYKVSEELWSRKAVMGVGVITLVPLNMFIVAADIWRTYINKVLDGKCGVSARKELPEAEVSIEEEASENE